MRTRSSSVWCCATPFDSISVSPCSTGGETFFKDFYAACRLLYEKRAALMQRLYDTETVCIENL